MLLFITKSVPPIKKPNQKLCYTHRRDQSWTIWSYQPGLVLRLEHVCDPDHVVLWNAFRNAYCKSDLSLERLFYTCCGEWWRKEQRGGISLDLFDSVGDVCEYRFAEVL